MINQQECHQGSVGLIEHPADEEFPTSELDLLFPTTSTADENTFILFCREKKFLK
jgi:hypothetical protein